MDINPLFAPVDRVRELYLAALRALGEAETAMEDAVDGALTPQVVATQLLLAGALEALGDAALKLRAQSIESRPAGDDVLVH